MDLDLDAIGARLREVRGALTQAGFADRLGIERKTVGRYEAGERAPDAVALLRLMAEFSVDPAWLLSGAGAAPVLSPDERELLALFRAAPLGVKAAAIGALQGGLSGGGVQQHGLTFNNNTPGGVQVGYVAGKSTVIHKTRK